MITKDIIIVGTGFAGMGMAMKLREAGREDFTILEKAHDVGGTWRDNTYPGCECDIPSHMYSFSYELNTDWSKSYSGQQEIWAYMRKVADEKGIRPYINFGVEVTGATWDEDRQRWTVNTASGEIYECRVLVAGVGGLHIPNIPEIDGADTFAGPMFHSASWDHSVDLTGKKVVVIGTGASAIQFVPIIAEQVGQLTVFQRTAPWVLPKKDKPTAQWRKTAVREGARSPPRLPQRVVLDLGVASPWVQRPPQLPPDRGADREGVLEEDGPRRRAPRQADS